MASDAAEHGVHCLPFPACASGPASLLPSRRAGRTPVYGMSVTAPCLDWGTTSALLGTLAAAVKERRAATHSDKKARTA